MKNHDGAFKCIGMVPHILKLITEMEMSDHLHSVTVLLKGKNANMYKYITTGLNLYYIRDSAVCIATGYGLDDRKAVVRVPVGPRIF
jgi:hypothetical protein